MSAWRFLLDVNVDPKVVSYVEEEDLVAHHVQDALGAGADDESDVLPYVCDTD